MNGTVEGMTILRGAEYRMRQLKSDDTQTRWSLIHGLKDWDDNETWQEFFDTYGRLVHAVALKAGLTEVEAQEVVQETVISVAKTMSRFRFGSEHGSFKAWLMNVTRRRIADQFRKRPPAGRFDHAADPNSTDTAFIERVPDPAKPPLDTLWDAEWREKLMQTAVERVKQRVSSKQYEVFRLLTVEQMSPESVATLLNLRVPNVYLIKHRVAAALKEEVERLEAETSG